MPRLAAAGKYGAGRSSNESRVRQFFISAGEGFVEMLQSARRAKVVGEATMGAACTSRIPMALMNSASLYFSNLRHLHLDGTGCPSSITPDVAVQLDPKALAEGRDTLLEAGLKTLK